MNPSKPKKKIDKELKWKKCEVKDCGLQPHIWKHLHTTSDLRLIKPVEEGKGIEAWAIMIDNKILNYEDTGRYAVYRHYNSGGFMEMWERNSHKKNAKRIKVRITPLNTTKQ